MVFQTIRSALIVTIIGALLRGIALGQSAAASTNAIRVHGIVKGPSRLLEQLDQIGLTQNRNRVDNATVRLKTVPGDKIVGVTNTSPTGSFELEAPRPGRKLADAKPVGGYDCCGHAGLSQA